jgi:formylglycine-generating enzyme
VEWRGREETAVEQQVDRQGQAGDLGDRGWLRIDEAVLLIQRLRMGRLFSSIVAVFFAAITFSIQASALVDQGSGFSNSGVEGEADQGTRAFTFGTTRNEFTIDFVTVGNTGNAADTTGYGAVPYEYRIGTYEISQDAITKATASGMANVTAGPWTGNQPAATISWYEAAAFVNWLNTSTGKQAAYNLTFSGSWSMSLWSSADAWQLGGENLYRNKDAHYFLPSENEWYKAAYYNPAGSDYFLYPTASSSAPTAVASGTDAGTAVYNNAASVPATVDSAGGLSSYETMGQGGNAYEWNESGFDGTNNSSSEDRVVRGGDWVAIPPAGNSYYSLPTLSSAHRSALRATFEDHHIGFRVASVPEPSTYALLVMTAAGALWWARRRR